jgi:carbonic anhydrase
MKKTILVLLMLMFSHLPVFANHVISNITADESLTKLKDGNTRFVNMKLINPDQSLERRKEGMNGQHPFVIILTCSDSRVSPEVIFDQGLGDIFEIRNAGNVLDDHVIGSIEYAVAHLDIPLLIIMGHEDCGAIKATISHAHDSKHIESLVKSLSPAVEGAKGMKGDLVENSVRNNVRLEISKITNNKPILAQYIKEGKLRVLGAYYHIENGKVEFSK